MEIWLLYAIASALAAGGYNFALKMIAERHYDTYLVTCYDYFFWSIIAWGYLLWYLQENSLTQNELFFTTILAFINVMFFSASIMTRVESMRNIDTVIFFPLYKTIWPIIVTAVSLLFFQELLTMKEVVGIIVGITVPLLLINKVENRIQKNLFWWVILVVITAILSTISASSAKQVMVSGFSVELFVFMTFFFGIFFTYGGYHFHSRHSHKKYITKGIVKFSAITGLIHILSFIFFSLALTWNFAVVFTINSFGILVPIILSIFFYGEHFNLRKGIVIWLSIISILLFI